jgi:DNA-directed RNA polymerase subunit RPC12/RpoP
MEKVEKHCSNCNTKYSITWDEEKNEGQQPWTCPFCGYEVDDEEDNGNEVPEEAEHDSWN